MHIDPALTFRGALSVLGVHERPVLESVDRLLGGLILASPSVNGTMSMLGLVDAKMEARGLIRDLLDRCHDRLLGTSGYQRHQLITAAHSIIVVSAFFDVLRERVGPANYRRLALTRQERAALTAQRSQADAHLLDRIVDADVPMPYAYCGFHENSANVRRFLEELCRSTLRFLDGLRVWHEIGWVGELQEGFVAGLVAGALERYEADYRNLMRAAPEFRMWVQLGEHHATRVVVGAAEMEVLAALGAQDRQLRELRELIAATGTRHEETERTLLAGLNQAVLQRPVISNGALEHVDRLVFPDLRDCYVVPSFQVALAGPSATPAKEDWWTRQPVRRDLFDLFTAHLCSPHSTRLPMLVLGHPGAGKSLLMKFLAGWLPDSTFTVVRVPLRRVDAGAPIHRQIEQALAADTHDRVSWTELTRQSRDVVRVVLLDGLDELMQATNVSQSNYLELVAAFQQREAELGTPVAVIVTTRTIVADRAHIPDGCLMVKLADFDKGQIGSWLAAWRRANAAGEAGGTFRALTLGSALRHFDLAAHPLLLLMLALYAADPEVPDPSDEILSTAMLYQRLLDNFIRRELAKTDDPRAIDDHAIAERLWYLGVAAFGMFNRGRQHVTGRELDRDFDALAVDGRPDPEGSIEAPLSHSQRVIGQFFFIHSAEARNHNQESQRSSYEFLHATFGEYLVAATSLELLGDVARRRQASRRDTLDEASTLLRTLLSHQPFVKRRSILTFAEQLHAAMPRQDAAPMVDTLHALIEHSTRMQAVRSERYHPSVADAVTHLAVYNANLVMLRAGLTGAVDIGAVVGPEASAHEWRRRTLRLWRAGLDDESWQIIVRVLTTTPDGATLLLRQSPSNGDVGLSHDPELLAEMAEARLLGDPARGIRLRLGQYALDSLGSGPEVEALMMLAITPTTNDEMTNEVREWFTELFTLSQISGVALTAPALALLANVLARFTRQLPVAMVSSLVRMVLDQRHRHLVDLSQDLVRIAAAHPELLMQYPALRGAIGDGPQRSMLLAAASLLASDTAPTHEDAVLNYLSYAVNRWRTADALLEQGTGPPGAGPNGTGS
ncbi:NACHT domain-containing protein [Micromonospora sp. NPDC004704]